MILCIDARAMREAGFVFFVTPNGVWLTDAVPSAFISGPFTAGSFVPVRDDE
jgi:putative RNA 2'-phosphotransferase